MHPDEAMYGLRSGPLAYGMQSAILEFLNAHFRISLPGAAIGRGSRKRLDFSKKNQQQQQLKTPSMPRCRRGSRRRGGEEDGCGCPGYPPWHATAVLFLLLVPTPVLILAVVAKYDTGYQRYPVLLCRCNVSCFFLTLSPSLVHIS